MPLIKRTFLFFTILLNFFAASAFANNLTISNVSLETRNAAANTVVVEFDISWDHSWRMSNGEHDAAWVFVKLLDGNTGTPTYPWLHGKLYTAGTNPNDGTSPGTNTNLEVVVPSDKIGAFIRRKVTGNGTVSSQNVRLVVDYGTAGASDTDTITAKVYGIEMVYIPEGPFYIGDGDGGETGEVINTSSGIFSSDDAFFSSFDSAGTYEWSMRLGGTTSDALSSITTGSTGNVIVAGYVSGNADLSGDGDTADSNESTGGVYANEDIFISVFDSAMTFQWSERLGGTSTDITLNNSIAVNSDGNVIAVGYVTGNADLSGDADTADTNESTGGVYSASDAFVSVFNSAGTFQWSERLGGTAGDLAYGVKSDNAANVVVIGYVTGNADLNGDADTADSNESTGGVYNGTDVFISKFNSAGTFQWSERLGGTSSSDYGNSIATNNAGDIIAVGGVSGNADLNGDADTADSNESTGGVYNSVDAFVSVFNSAGTFQWSERLGGTSTDEAKSILTNSPGDVVITGYVTGNADLNGDADTADTSESTGGVYNGKDVFVSVFNSAGTFQWSKRLGGTAADEGRGIITNSVGHVIVSGYVNGSADLNGDGDTADTNESTGGVYSSDDAFISVFNSAGTFLWSERLGGTTSDLGTGIAANAAGDVFVVGLGRYNLDLSGDADVGTETTRALHENGVDNTSVQITTTAKNITADSNTNDDIDTSPVSVDGDGGITGNSSWPVGYNDFYLMKYELAQQQYRDFLNTLSRTQQSTRVASTITADTVANYYVMSGTTTADSRVGIRAPASGNGTTNPITFGCDLNDNGTFNEADDGCSIAMTQVSWSDMAAYADWSGLRPITELEFEKATRGPLDSALREYAWGRTGSATTQSITGVSTILDSGRNTESSSEQGAGLCVYNNTLSGPMRVGFAATHASSRISAAAGYYGNMELSGNVNEMVVALGQSVGRSFTGTHGDGVVTTTTSYEGNATNNDWPGINATTARGVTAGTGAMTKGGGFTSTESVCRLSERTGNGPVSASRSSVSGSRFGRTAP